MISFLRKIFEQTDFGDVIAAEFKKRGKILVTLNLPNGKSNFVVDEATPDAVVGRFMNGSNPEVDQSIINPDQVISYKLCHDWTGK